MPFMNLLCGNDSWSGVADVLLGLRVDVDQTCQIDEHGYRLDLGRPTCDVRFCLALNFAERSSNDGGRPIAVVADDLATIYREVKGFDGAPFDLRGRAYRLHFIDVLTLLNNFERERFSKRYCSIYVPTWAALGSQSGAPGPSNARTEQEEALGESHGHSATESEELQLARIGQGAFRTRLFACFDGKCVVTGFDFAPALRASHIKAWSESSDEERLAVENGLLLRADIDALFDENYISFEDDGRLTVSSRLPAGTLKKLGVSCETSLPECVLSKRRRALLMSHRARLKR